jgi:tRNA(fMet)-specific endonuclease VapC
VLCELLAGILQRKDAQATQRRLQGLLQVVRIWPVDLEIAVRYGEVYQELKRAGRALSQVDMMLAAMSRHLNLTLLTTDGDFDALPDIRTENWLPR